MLLVSPAVKIEGSRIDSARRLGSSTDISLSVHFSRLASSRFTISGQYMRYLLSVKMSLINFNCLIARLLVLLMYSTLKVGSRVISHATRYAIKADFMWSRGNSNS